MRKVITTLILLLTALLTSAQTKTTYSEVNVGVCVGTVPFFPGASSMVGVTNKYPSGIILDYEGGIAFPTLLTGKIGLGASLDDQLDLTFGVRVFPSSFYTQLEVNRPEKRSDIVFTAEALLWGEQAFGQYSILTVGWRFNKQTRLFGWRNNNK